MRRGRWAGVAIVAAIGLSTVGVASHASAGWSPGGPSYPGAGLHVEVDPADDSLWASGPTGNELVRYDAAGELVLTVGGFGTGPGQFNTVSGIAVGPTGDVYGTDLGNKRVLRFTRAGDLVRAYGNTSLTSWSFGLAVAPDGTLYVGDYQTGLRAFADDGTPVKPFLSSIVRKAYAVALAPDGTLWASEFVDQDRNDRVYRIDPATGTVLATIGGFGQPTDIAVNPDGRISVVNFNTSTIRTYEPDGTFVEESQVIPGVNRIAIDEYGRLYGSNNGGGGVTTMLPDPVEITAFVGADATPTVDPGYVAATAGEHVELIDFDGDGFDQLAPHAYTALDEDHYAAQGVRLIGLDARSVGSEPWATSPPIGAWQQGFNQHAAETYSFELTTPVASFGLFMNDVEGAGPMMTVHLADGRREFVAIPAGGSADRSRFVGVTTADDAIVRVDIDSFGDFHIIDDVRFGRQAPATPVFGVSGISPAERAQGTGATTLAVEGDAFEPGATVRILGGGVPVSSATVRDARTIDVQASVGGSAALGARDVVVTNPGGAVVTCAGCFTVTGKPTLVTVTPGQQAQGAERVALAVTGSGFRLGATAAFSGTGVAVDGVTVVDDAHATVIVTIDPAAPTGRRTLTLLNPDGGKATKSAALTVSARPTVATATPNHLRQGTTSTITLAGSGFAGDLGTAGGSVTFGATAADSFLRSSGTKLTATVTIDPATAPGPIDVTVVNPDGGWATCTGCVVVVADPAVGAIAPAALARGATGQVVTISGAGFQPGAAVRVGGAGVTLGAPTVTDAGTISVAVTVGGTAALGARDLTVTNPDTGTVTCTGCFEVTAKPTIGVLTPSSRPRGSTGTVVVNGTGFLPGATVSFSGVGVDGTVVGVTATQLTVSVAVAPGAATGSRSLTVTNPDAGSATKAIALKVT